MSYCLLLAALAVCADDHGRDAVVVYRAALRHWRDETAFKGSFKFKSGTAKTIEAALRGEFDSFSTNGKPADNTNATGKIIKLKNKIRMRLEYEYSAIELVAPGFDAAKNNNSKGRPGAIINVNFDEISDGNITVSRIPKQGKLGDNAGVEKTRAEDRQRSVAGSHSRYLLSPLNPMTTDMFGPISLWGKDDIVSRSKTHVSVTTLDDDHITIVLESTDPSAQKRTVTLRTSCSPPAVESIRHSVVAPDGFRHECFSKLSDFVECYGGRVAGEFYTARRSRRTSRCFCVSGYPQIWGTFARLTLISC